MKNHLFSSVLIAFILASFCPNQASAFVIYIKLKQGELCLSGGADAGACQRGLAIFGGGEVDFLVNNKLVAGNTMRLTVNPNGRTASLSVESSSKSDAKAKPALVQQSIDLSKVMIKSRATGETISMKTYIDIVQNCKG